MLFIKEKIYIYNNNNYIKLFETQYSITIIII